MNKWGSGSGFLCMMGGVWAIAITVHGLEVFRSTEE